MCACCTRRVEEAWTTCCKIFFSFWALSVVDYGSSGWLWSCVNLHDILVSILIEFLRKYWDSSDLPRIVISVQESLFLSFIGFLWALIGRIYSSGFPIEQVLGQFCTCIHIGCSLGKVCILWCSKRFQALALTEPKLSRSWASFLHFYPLIWKLIYRFRHRWVDIDVIKWLKRLVDLLLNILVDLLLPHFLWLSDSR